MRWQRGAWGGDKQGGHAGTGTPKVPPAPPCTDTAAPAPSDRGFPRDPRVGMEGGSDPIPTGHLGTAWYSRRVFTQGSAFVLLHLLLPVDVVEPVGVH